MNVEPDATSQCPKCQKWTGMVRTRSSSSTYTAPGGFVREDKQTDPPECICMDCGHIWPKKD